MKKPKFVAETEATNGLSAGISMKAFEQTGGELYFLTSGMSLPLFIRVKENGLFT